MRYSKSLTSSENKARKPPTPAAAPLRRVSRSAPRAERSSPRDLTLRVGVKKSG